MASDPRGRWFRVYARMVGHHRKFRDLSAVELGSWTALRSECELRDGHLLTDKADARLILRRRHVPAAAKVLDRLIELHLFDVAEDGSVSVHDREDHDRPPYPSDDPEKVRERVNRHRESKRNEDVTSGNEKVTTPVRARSGAGAGDPSLSVPGEGSGERVPEGWDNPDVVVAWNNITGRYPSDRVCDWLNRLSNDHPEEAIIRLLAEQWASEPNPRTLLSRTENELKLDAHRRNRAEESARNLARMKAEEPHRRREAEATPEEIERARLQRQAISIGLHRGLPVPTDPREIRKFVMKHGEGKAS